MQASSLIGSIQELLEGREGLLGEDAAKEASSRVTKAQNLVAKCLAEIGVDDEKVKAFFEEHIHDAEEIRYILGGSGYFDVRSKDDKWIRVHIKKGDLMTLPEGIYHRFTVDETDMIHAMRLFIGQPVWTPFNRPCEDHPSRKKFVEEYLTEEKKGD